MNQMRSGSGQSLGNYATADVHFHGIADLLICTTGSAIAADVTAICKLADDSEPSQSRSQIPKRRWSEDFIKQ
jgi:hypothetical protein